MTPPGAADALDAALDGVPPGDPVVTVLRACHGLLEALAGDLAAVHGELRELRAEQAHVPLTVAELRDELRTMKDYADQLADFAESLRNVKLPGFLAGVIKLPERK